MRAFAFAGVLAGAGCAAAQDDGFVFNVTNPVLSPSGFDTDIVLLAKFPSADYAFAGARLSVRASESGWSDPATVAPGGSGPGTSAGVIDGLVVRDIIVGQLNFPTAMIYADPSNPIAVWKARFATTDFTIRSVDFVTETSVFAVYPDRASSISQTRSPVMEARGTLAVIPAPGAAAVIVLAGLAASRRRRAG